jgi:signal transduction histidine kinase
VLQFPVTPATDHSADPRVAELESFIALATRELKTYVESIRVYAALLDAQLAPDPSSSRLREILSEVCAQANTVATLVDDGSN